MFLAGDTSPVVGSLVLSAGWGSGPEQVAIGEGAPVWGPTDFALSQDCSTIAILDSWNGRVQMYDMSGGVVSSTPIPGSIGIYLEYLANGNLVLFHSGEENQLPTVRPGGDEAGNTYVQLEVGSYDQPASAPYRVIRINRDGKKTGELALTDR